MKEGPTEPVRRIVMNGVEHRPTLFNEGVKSLNEKFIRAAAAHVQENRMPSMEHILSMCCLAAMAHIAFQIKAFERNAGKLNKEDRGRIVASLHDLAQHIEADGKDEEVSDTY